MSAVQAEKEQRTRKPATTRKARSRASSPPGYTNATAILLEAERALSRLLCSKERLDINVEECGRRIEILEVRRQKASEDGDTDAVVELSREIQGLRETIEATKSIRDDLTPLIDKAAQRVMEAEEVVAEAMATRWSEIASEARREFVQVVATAGLKAWRAAVAAGETETPFRAWISSQGIMDDVWTALSVNGDDGLFGIDIGVKLPESAPRCDMVDAEMRRRLRAKAVSR